MYTDNNNYTYTCVPDSTLCNVVVSHCWDVCGVIVFHPQITFSYMYIHTDKWLTIAYMYINYLILVNSQQMCDTYMYNGAHDMHMHNGAHDMHMYV